MNEIKPRPMTPAVRASLIARAKRAAVPVANCVAASIPPARVLGKLTEAEKDALIIVLAEAVDHALLRVVVEADDDGRPEVPAAPACAVGDGLPEMPHAERLRRAHAEAMRLRRAGQPVPNPLRRLDNDYHEALKAGRKAAAAAMAPRDPQAETSRDLDQEAAA